jgi:hypothetical protein
VAVVGLLLTACAGSSEPTSATGGIPASVRAHLLELALTTARRNGDPQPYNIEAVRTTYGQALALRHAGYRPEAPTNVPVYMVAMEGSFATPDHSVPLPPPGQTVRERPIPTVIWFEVDIGKQAKGQGAGMGWGGPYPELSEAGVPVRLGRS